MKKQKQENKIEKVKTQRAKKTYTYAEAHNRAFWAFNKSSRIMIWAAVLNVIGLMIAIIQANFDTLKIMYRFAEGSLLGANVVQSVYQYSLCYSFNAFVYRLLEIPAFNALNDPTLSLAGFIVVIVLLAIIMSAGTVYISVLASQGRKWALYTQTIFYLFDTAMIIGCYLIGETTQFLWMMAGLHAIILFFIGVSLYQYYHIYAIEKIYKNNISKEQPSIDKINTKLEKNETFKKLKDDDEIKKEETKDGTNL